MNKKEIIEFDNKLQEDIFEFRSKIIGELDGMYKKAEVNKQAKELFDLDSRETNRMLMFHNITKTSKYDLPKNFNIFMLIYDKLKRNDKNAKGVSKVYGKLKLENDIVTKYVVIEYFSKITLDYIKNKEQKQNIKSQIKDIEDEGTSDLAFLNHNIITMIEEESEEKVLEEYGNNTLFYFKRWNEQVGIINKLLEELKEESTNLNMDSKSIEKISKEVNKHKEIEQRYKEYLDKVHDFKKQYIKSQEYRLHKA